MRYDPLLFSWRDKEFSAGQFRKHQKKNPWTERSDYMTHGLTLLVAPSDLFVCPTVLSP